MHEVRFASQGGARLPLLILREKIAENSEQHSAPGHRNRVRHLRLWTQLDGIVSFSHTWTQLHYGNFGYTVRGSIFTTVLYVGLLTSLGRFIGVGNGCEDSVSLT